MKRRIQLTVNINGSNISDSLTNSVGLVSRAVIGSFTSKLDLVISDSNDGVFLLKFTF